MNLVCVAFLILPLCPHLGAKVSGSPLLRLLPFVISGNPVPNKGAVETPCWEGVRSKPLNKVNKR